MRRSSPVCRTMSAESIGRGRSRLAASFVPPDATRLPALMRELVEWLRADDLRQHTVVRAGLTHLNVVSIHPWTNGNGRTARVAGSLALMRRGISAPELVNIESWIWSHPDAYAAVLQETHGPDYRPDERSATAWLEYFGAICVDRLDLRNRLLAAAQADIGILVIESQRARPAHDLGPSLARREDRGDPHVGHRRPAGSLGAARPRDPRFDGRGRLAGAGRRSARSTLRGGTNASCPRPSIARPDGATTRGLLDRIESLDVPPGYSSSSGMTRTHAMSARPAWARPHAPGIEFEECGDGRRVRVGLIERRRQQRTRQGSRIHVRPRGEAVETLRVLVVEQDIDAVALPTSHVTHLNIVTRVVPTRMPAFARARARALAGTESMLEFGHRRTTGRPIQSA